MNIIPKNKSNFRKWQFLPNLISIIRLILTFPAAYFLYYNNLVCFFIVAGFAFLSDYLDGYFARKLNIISELGKILDPLADKIFIGVIALILLLQGKMPLWFALIIWGRDLILLIGGLLVSNKRKFVMPSNYIGKITVNVIAAAFIAIVFELGVIKDILIYLSAGLVILSLIIYVRKAFTEFSN